MSPLARAALILADRNALPAAIAWAHSVLQRPTSFADRITYQQGARPCSH